MINDKAVTTVKNHQSLTLNLVTTSEVLRTCYGKHATIEKFVKAILTIASIKMSNLRF